MVTVRVAPICDGVVSDGPYARGRVLVGRLEASATAIINQTVMDVCLWVKELVISLGFAMIPTGRQAGVS